MFTIIRCSEIVNSVLHFDVTVLPCATRGTRMCQLREAWMPTRAWMAWALRIRPADENARVAELVDATDLKSVGCNGHAGSSPAPGNSERYRRILARRNGVPEQLFRFPHDRIDLGVGVERIVMEKHELFHSRLGCNSSGLPKR